MVMQYVGVHCRDPVLGSLAISLGITTVAALIDWRKTLQFVGAFGVLTTLGTVPVRYNSLEVTGS